MGLEAIDALWQRAVSREEREGAFRMRMAALLGSGRDASAARFLAEGRSRGVPTAELDRWLLLSGVTALPELSGNVVMEGAASRLAASPDTDVVNQWLAARWFRTRDADRAADIHQRLRPLAQDSDDFPPVFRSLIDDLDALSLLAHDTAGALETWRRATQRFSVEQILFELVASLWPLRMARARVALAAGRYTETLEATAGFVRIAAFTDQVAWPHVLPLRAEAALALGDTALASNTYRAPLQVIVEPDGAGVEAIARVQRALERRQRR